MNKKTWLYASVAFAMTVFVGMTGVVIWDVTHTNPNLTVDYAATGPDVKPASEYAEEVDGIVEYGAGERSGHWPTVMHHFRNNEFYDWRTKKSHPFTDGIDRSVCRCCGGAQDLNVHHIKPFHIDAALELDPNNLVTLCREHHFHIGHHDNWKNANPNVCADCDTMRAKLNPNRK